MTLLPQHRIHGWILPLLTALAVALALALPSLAHADTTSTTSTTATPVVTVSSTPTPDPTAPTADTPATQNVAPADGGSFAQPDSASWR